MPAAALKPEQNCHRYICLDNTVQHAMQVSGNLKLIRYVTPLLRHQPLRIPSVLDVICMQVEGSPQ